MRLQKDFGPIARQTPLLTHVCFVYLVSNIYPNYLSMVFNLRKIILGWHFVKGKAPIVYTTECEFADTPKTLGIIYGCSL